MEIGIIYYCVIKSHLLTIKCVHFPLLSGASCNLARVLLQTRMEEMDRAVIQLCIHRLYLIAQFFLAIIITKVITNLYLTCQCTCIHAAVTPKRDPVRHSSPQSPAPPPHSPSGWLWTASAGGTPCFLVLQSSDGDVAQ